MALAEKSARAYILYSNYLKLQFILKTVDFSNILLFENENNPFEARRQAILNFSKHAIDIISVNQIILQKANEARSTGLRAKDSLHIACAIYAKCDYFITTDDRVLKYKDDSINIIDPIDFIKVWEGTESD